MKNCYTYLIGWSDYNLFYYGSKFAKNSNPDKFWVTYFTSSKYVKQARQKFGEPDIIQIRKTFGEDSSKCYNWETKVLRRMKVKTNDLFINISENTRDISLKNMNKGNKLAITLGTHNFISNHPMKSDRNKKIIGESNKKRAEKGLLNCQINNPMKNKDIANKSRLNQINLAKEGKHWSQKQEYRDKMSLIMKSKNNIMSEYNKNIASKRMIKNNPMSQQSNKDKMASKFIQNLITHMEYHSLHYNNKNEWDESMIFLKNNKIVKITRSYDNYIKYKDMI